MIKGQLVMIKMLRTLQFVADDDDQNHEHTLLHLFNWSWSSQSVCLGPNISPAGGRRAVWGDEPREELYKEVIEEQSKRNKELAEENENLRKWWELEGLFLVNLFSGLTL